MLVSLAFALPPSTQPGRVGNDGGQFSRRDGLNDAVLPRRDAAVRSSIAMPQRRHTATARASDLNS